MNKKPITGGDGNENPDKPKGGDTSELKDQNQGPAPAEGNENPDKPKGGYGSELT